MHRGIRLSIVTELGVTGFGITGLGIERLHCGLQGRVLSGHFKKAAILKIGFSLLTGL